MLKVRLFHKATRGIYQLFSSCNTFHVLNLLRCISVVPMQFENSNNNLQTKKEAALPRILVVIQYF
jgi:hypothetical protein